MPRAGQEETPRRACRDLSERRRLSTKLRGDSGAQDHRGYLLEEGGRRRPWCVASRAASRSPVGGGGRRRRPATAIEVEEQLGEGERSVVWVLPVGWAGLGPCVAILRWFAAKSPTSACLGLFCTVELYSLISRSSNF